MYNFIIMIIIIIIIIIINAMFATQVFV